MPKHKLQVEKRSLGENLTQLRSQQIVPGNIFGPSMDSQSIKFEVGEFERLFREIGESGVAYLQLGKKEVPAMIDELQIEPVQDLPTHVSFKAIDLTEKVRADIPVELVGEFELPEAVLVTVRNEVEVEALPTDLPEKFVVNVEILEEIGQAITLADLEYDKEKVDIIFGEAGEEAPVVLVQEVEEEPEEPEEIETEIIGEEEEGGEEVEGEEGQEIPEEEAPAEEGEKSEE